MNTDLHAIGRALATYPNANLTIAPTPIYRLDRISDHVGHNIYVMREDLTGFAIGGNKVRKLDFLIADAKASGADTLITMTANNFTRNAAAAGKLFGFDVHVVLAGKESEQNPASQALYKLYGANLYYVPGGDPEELQAKYAGILDGLKSRGRAVYELHQGGSDKIGALGYVNAFDQIVRYSHSTGVHFSKILHAASSTGTQVGLLLGRQISGYETEIIGMAAKRKADAQIELTRDLAITTAEMLGVPLDESRIIVDDEFVGPGYQIPSAEGREATELFALKEGILLDDVYTGKAAAGLLHYAGTGRLDRSGNSLFIHTGGNAGQYY